jgi:hypothetical protein
MRVRDFVGMVGTGLILAACATGGGASSARLGDTITQEQIESYSGDSVFLLIQSYHPSWLRERGRTSLAGPVMVYIDDIPQPDGVESLRALRPLQVQEIKYLDSREATNRFGTGHANGAILVTLR